MVKEIDLVFLVISIMDWKNIYYMLVENVEGKLCGLLIWMYVKKMKNKKMDKNIIVKDIMVENVIIVIFIIFIKEVIIVMKENFIGCLFVF